MAGAVAPPTTPKSTVNLGPLWQAATDQAKAAIQPQIDTLNQQMAGSDATATQRETDAQNAGDAASALIASLIKPVSGAYETAGQNQELAASGFSQGMQDALKGNTDNLNTTLKSLNTPAQLDSHAGQAGDLLYSLGGFNPGTTFAKQGAAAAQGLAGTASAATLLGLENAKQVRADAITNDVNFQNKIADLAAKLPGDIETNYQKLQQMALADKKFAHQIAQDKFNNTFKVGQANEKIAEFNARQNLSVMKMNQQARQFAVRQANADRSYALSLAHLGIAQKNQQMKIAAQEFKLQNGGFSGTQIARFNGIIQTAANAIKKVTAPDGSEQFLVPKTKGGKPTLPITYTDFVKQAVAKGAPLSLVIARANTIFPETQRPTPEVLAGATGMSEKAASALSGYSRLQGDYNKMTGVTLGTSPNGKAVTFTAPSNLPAPVRQTVQSILSQASEYLGTPYAWGGESPTGFDCSGLAQYVYAKAGVQIPRTTYDQFKGGLAVPKSQLQPGDLVFFKGSDSKNGLPGHVGIYVGGGKMIQAPHTGDVVQVSSVSSFPGYQGARRYVH